LSPPPFAATPDRLIVVAVVLVLTMLPDAIIARVLPTNVMLPKFFRSTLPAELAIVPAPCELKISGLPVTVPWLLNRLVLIVSEL
jgi:hypothetical protein